MVTADEYDGRRNAGDGYEHAVSEIRRRGVYEGRFKPINAAERRLARRGDLDRAGGYLIKTVVALLAVVGLATIIGAVQ